MRFLYLCQAPLIDNNALTLQEKVWLCKVSVLFKLGVAAVLLNWFVFLRRRPLHEPVLSGLIRPELREEGLVGLGVAVGAGEAAGCAEDVTVPTRSITDVLHGFSLHGRYPRPLRGLFPPRRAAQHCPGRRHFRRLILDSEAAIRGVDVGVPARPILPIIEGHRSFRWVFIVKRRLRHFYKI